MIENHLSQIINSQQNLKGIFFTSNNFPLYNALLSLKYSNSLKIIFFYNINFKNIIILNEVFEHLNVLESIHLCFCHSLNSQQIINITKSLKLRGLTIDDETFQIESFQLLLQLSGDHLENIGFGSLKSNELKQQLHELIIKYCTNIKFICIVGIDDQNIYLAFDLIKHFGEALNYIYISNIGHHVSHNIQSSSELIKLGSIILQGLGQILPSKLEGLKLHLSFTVSDFEVFLRNSKNTFIIRLLIRNEMQVESGDIFLPYIEEYIIKKKKVKYIAFMINDFIGRNRDLSSLKDEVKKIKSYNIMVQHYYHSSARFVVPQIPKYMQHYFIPS